MYRRKKGNRLERQAGPDDGGMVRNAEDGADSQVLKGPVTWPVLRLERSPCL